MGIEAVLGPLSVFFLWIGMWRYWIRIDNSSRREKIISFILLFVGMFYGAVIYYFFVYRSQVVSGSWAKPGDISLEGRKEISNQNVQKVFFVGIFSLFILAMAFGLLLPILFKRVLLPNSEYIYEIPFDLALSASVFLFLTFLVVMLFRLGTIARPLWRIQQIVVVGLGSVLGFALVFVLFIPILLRRLLPPQFEDSYEISLDLGLSLGFVVVLVYSIVKLIRKVAKSRRHAQMDAGARWPLRRIWSVGFASLFAFMLVFGLLFNILLKKFLPGIVSVYSTFVFTTAFVGIISLCIYLIVGVFRLGMKRRQ